MIKTNSLLDKDYLVHLPIVRGFLAGPIAIPVNIMLDTGSTVNLINKRQVGRFMTNYNIDQNSVFTEVSANCAVTLNSVTTSRNWDAQLLQFKFTRLANYWVEAIVMDNLHSFPRMELDESIVNSFEMDGPFPRPQGEVDILLGCADSLRFLKKRHIFLKKDFALLSTVYGYVPCGSQQAMALTKPDHTSTPLTLHTLRQPRR